MLTGFLWIIELCSLFTKLPIWRVIDIENLNIGEDGKVLHSFTDWKIKAIFCHLYEFQT